MLKNPKAETVRCGEKLYIHPYDSYLLSTYYVLVTILGTEEYSTEQADKELTY